MVRSSALLTCVLLAAAGASGQRVVVPSVGCAAEGMFGHVDAPRRPPHARVTAPDQAAKLAYYSGDGGMHVLAPRGWHCIEIYGSNGSDLLVTPPKLNEDSAGRILQSGSLSGPAVVLTFSLGFTSGRDEVSLVAGHAFPWYRRLVYEPADNYGTPRPKILGPFSTDRMHYLSRKAVEFTTPAGHKGLGTLLSAMRPEAGAISGAHILVLDRGTCCDLFSLSIRMPEDDPALAAVIVRQAERDAKGPTR